MKNVHILPKSSPQNIYITSDEEIKVGDWTLMFDSFGHLFLSHKPQQYLGIEKGHHLNRGLRKIILTTDGDLIKDSVKAIDDEFLEWFLKNPSCEKVEVEEEDYSQRCKECGETVKRGYNCSKGCFMKSGNFIPTDKNIKYKIIIPTEEVKQEIEKL